MTTEIPARVAGKTGRLPRDPHIPVAQLGPHLARGSASGYLHVPPSSVDFYSDVKDWGVMLNDSLGDCTCAADGHICRQQNVYGRGVDPLIPDQEILSAYEVVGGYVPGKPQTDQGALITDALDYLVHNGIGGWRIAAYGEIDPSETESVRRAVWEFGAVSIGLQLPANAIGAFNAGQPWTDTSEPGADGHNVVVVGYDTDRLYVVSWGQIQTMTWAWLAKYCDEAHAIISKSWQSKSGLDLSDFGAEFAAIYHLPNPFGVTPPRPAPAPPAPAKRSIWRIILDFFFGGHLP